MKTCVLLVLVGLTVPAVESQPTPLPAFEPLPAIDASAMDGAIAQGLGAARRLVEEDLRRQPADLEALARSYGELGRRAFSYSLTDLARAALTNAARLEPEAYRWHYLLGALFQQQRRLEEAARELGAALERQPGDLPAQVRLAQVEQLLSGPEAARPLFERLVKLAGTSTRYGAAAHYGLGQIALAGRQPETAVRELARAYQLAPEAAEVAQQLGLAYRELGRIDEARRLLTAPPKGRLSYPDPEVEALQTAYPFGFLFQGIQARAGGRLDDAAKAFRAASEAEPENATLRRALASTLIELEQPAAAVPHLEAALRLDPGHLETRLRLARAHLRLNQETQATVELDAILAQSQDHLEALLTLGAIQSQGAGRERAEAALGRVLELGRKPADLSLAHYRLARLEISRGKTVEARRHFEESLVLTPRYRPAVMGLADLLAATGERSAAIGVLAHALELETDPRERSLFLFNAAVLEQQGGALEKALAGYTEAARIAPDSFDAHFYRGALLGRMGRFADAASSLARAVELVPAHPQAALALASALASSGQPEAARSGLEKALAESRARQAPAADITRLEQALSRLRNPLP